MGSALYIGLMHYNINHPPTQLRPNGILQGKVIKIGDFSRGRVKTYGIL